MAEFLRGKDTVSGQEGRAYMTFNGQVQLMFYISNITATINKNKVEIRTVGRRGTQRKANGWTGTGSMNVFYVTSVFRQMMQEYKDTGVDAFFDIQVINDDPTSSVGTQEVTLIDVNLDGVTLAMLDAGSDAMQEDIAFTFDDFDLGSQFNEPVLGQQ